MFDLNRSIFAALAVAGTVLDSAEQALICNLNLVAKLVLTYHTNSFQSEKRRTEEKRISVKRSKGWYRAYAWHVLKHIISHYTEGDKGDDVGYHRERC